MVKYSKRVKDANNPKPNTVSGKRMKIVKSNSLFEWNTIAPK